jgi:fused signal recognition particle receptor
MVFNWFRRQIGTSDASSEETRSETPQVEEEQQVTEEQPAQSTEELLQWAKAAYKNIQKQQEPLAPEAATQSAEMVTPKASEASQEAASTETAEVKTEEAPTLVEPAVAEIEGETTTEAEEVATDPSVAYAEELAAQEGETLPEAAPESVAAEDRQEVAAPEVEATELSAAVEAIEEVETETPISEDATLGSTEATAREDTVTLESGDRSTEAVAPAPEESVAVEPEAVPLAAESEEASTASVPIWARSSAERQARLERLKETAIELPEPEPIKPPVQPPVETAATTTVEAEELPGLAFDEGFLWSAQVLAAQGRRPDDVSVEEISWLKQLRQGLDRTRRSLVNQLKAIVGQGPLNQDAVMEIEALLLQADVGIEATDYIIDTLQKKLREETLPPEQAIAYLKEILRNILDQPYQDSYSPTFTPEKDTLNIWLMTGVNGAGKTTTIGKIAHLAQKSGYRCLIGAADTFRAAAVEQVKIWGERSGTEVIANPGKNTDPAAVVFDAITAAQARDIELLLVDTAGRLQNKKNLMEELAKIRRIVDRKAPNAKVEALLVLDATLGQNGLRQAEVFSQAAKLSGVVLTKLDSTAKGGVALAVVRELGLPIRFIGAGEGIEDLRPFSSYEFVEALLSG